MLELIHVWQLVVAFARVRTRVKEGWEFVLNSGIFLPMGESKVFPEKKEP